MKGLLFTLGLTYGGFFISLFRPWYGLLIYVCFSILRPDTLWFWSVEPGNYTRTIAIGLLIGWFLSGCGTWNLHGARYALYALVAYWLAIIFSTANARFLDVALAYVDLFTKILIPIVIGLSMIDSESRLKQLVWVFVASLGYVGYEANLDHLLGGTRLREVGYFGIDNNSACIALVSGTGLAFFLGLAEKAWWKKLVCFGIAAMLVHCCMFGDSRGGMLGVVISGIVTFIVIPKRPLNLTLMAVAVIAAERLAGPHVRERFMTIFASEESRDDSAMGRLRVWGYCWEAMVEYPLSGLGPDHFPLLSKERMGHALESHMLWLNAGAELGFPGMLSLMAYYGITALQLFARLWRRRFATEWEASVARGTVVSILGFCTSASFVAIDALEPPYFLAMIGAGILRVNDLKRYPSRPLRRTASMLGGAGPSSAFRPAAH